MADSRWKKDRPNSAPQAPREATRHAERDEYESPSSVGPNLRVEPLAEHRQTCSLKCSSLAQAVASLDESYEVVALLDADTVPHRTWLRELVQPLADPGVGAATGNRWYMPAAITWATLVRYLWNAAAIVQMYCYGIPWGGTLALKLNVLRRTGLLQLWKHAFCEDTMLYKARGAEGLRVAFVPSLMMVNREACEMSGFISWLQRQLLTARLYHPGWPAVVLHGFATPLMLALGMILFAAALLRSDGPSAAWIGSGLACYLGLLPCLLALIESSVRRIVRASRRAHGLAEPVGSRDDLSGNSPHSIGLSRGPGLLDAPSHGGVARRPLSRGRPVADPPDGVSHAYGRTADVERSYLALTMLAFPRSGR